MKKQQTTGWCLFEPKGIMLPYTFELRKKDVIKNRTSDGSAYRWSHYKKRGWTCRKVMIKEL